MGTATESAMGFLIGLNIYSILKLYYWRHARTHYIVSIIVASAYGIGVVWYDAAWSEAAMLLAILFCVFYAWRRIRIIEAFETRTGIRVRQQKYSTKELENGAVQPYQDTLTGGEESPAQKRGRIEDEKDHY